MIPANTPLRRNDMPPATRLTWLTYDTLAVAMLYVLLGFVMLAPMLSDKPASGMGEGNALRQVVYMGVFGLSLLSAQITKFPGRLLAIPISLTLMIGWCVLSLVWSLNPSVGGRRLFLTVIIIWSLFLLVQRIGYERAVTAARHMLLMVLIANFVAVIGWPGFGIHSAVENDPSIAGAWRGIMMQKNFAGAACAFTVFFYVQDAKKVNLLLRIGVVAASVVFLYFSKSKTSMGLILFSLVLAALYGRYDPRYRLATIVTILAVIGVSALLIWQNWQVLTLPFQDPRALTGRVQIWPVLLEFSRDHPLGAGFGSFWNIGDDDPIKHYTKGWVAKIVSGHNGYLDILVQLGIPGLILLIATTIVWPIGQLLTVANLDRTRCKLVLSCVWFAACHNLTESSLFDRDANVHVFLMLALALLGLELARVKAAGAAHG